MDRPKEAIALAERQAREAEERVARQVAAVEALDAAGHAWAAGEARKTLAFMRAGLDHARANLVAARLLLDGEPGA